MNRYNRYTVELNYHINYLQPLLSLYRKFINICLLIFPTTMVNFEVLANLIQNLHVYVGIRHTLNIRESIILFQKFV